MRDLGVYADVLPSDTPASELTGRKGVIISGGPGRVYDPLSPTLHGSLLQSGHPVLGICYGQQLMAHLLGGEVRKGELGEYGFAQLEIQAEGAIFRGIEKYQQVWMSHRDQVASLPSRLHHTGSAYAHVRNRRDCVFGAAAFCGAVSSGSRAHAVRQHDPF